MVSFLDAADIVGAVRRDPNVSPAFAAALDADAEFARGLVGLGMSEEEAAAYVRQHSATKALPPEEKHAGWSRDFGLGIADDLLAMARRNLW